MTGAVHMRAAFEALSFRERILVAIAVGLMLTLVFSILIWRPLAAWRQRSLEDLRISSLVLTRLGSAPQTLQRSGAGDPDIASSAANAGLSLQSLEPEGDSVRVRIEGAPYARAITWIAGLDQQRPGQVITVKLEKGAASGLVNADLLLAGERP